MSDETEWRIIRQEKDPLPAVRNMGVDESILEHVSAGESPPTIRFYSWKPSAISIGYFQSLDMEIDVDSCRELGVDMVRRITGGGAVYHDEVGELTYSVVVPIGTKGIPKDILGSYKIILNGLMEGLRRSGIESDYRPLNDIVLKGKKISGNAQTRRKSCILQHGTILLSVDVDTMFKLLMVPDEKMKGKMIERVKESVTSMADQLGEKPDITDVAADLQEGLASNLPGVHKTGKIEDSEWRRSLEIAEERYGNWAWTSKR